VNALFICKRYYTGKDVIRHRFGRLYEIPKQLAGVGHHVTVICFDYRNDDRCESFSQQEGTGSVSWVVISWRDIFSFRARSIYKQLKAFQPRVVIGSSDIPCLWFSRKFALGSEVPYIVDLYDNYESFGQGRIPGFRYALRLSIRDASGVLAVSGPLKEKVVRDCAPKAPVVVLNNGISRSVFCEGDRLKARNALRLPLEARLIGTAGNLSAMKGLDTLYAAWPAL
jgi:glycosyltransferase involved in cell wall biosynthesis